MESFYFAAVKLGHVSIQHGICEDVIITTEGNSPKNVERHHRVNSHAVDFRMQ